MYCPLTPVTLCSFSCHSEAERGGGIFFFATAACSGSIRRICGRSTTKHNTPLMLPVMQTNSRFSRAMLSADSSAAFGFGMTRVEGSVGRSCDLLMFNFQGEKCSDLKLAS
jgi:hypothetical protein